MLHLIQMSARHRRGRTWKTTTMKQHFSFYCVALILLLGGSGAKPLSDVQTLKELLQEENNAAPYSSEEVEAKDVNPAVKFEVEGGRERSWDFSDPRNSVLVAKKNLLMGLLSDLLRISKRSWSRYKKGSQRSCFGVRLDRIGSFSGLGC